MTALLAKEKARIIAGATDLMVNVLGRDPNDSIVVIEEVDTDNSMHAGKPVTVRRQCQHEHEHNKG